MGQKFCTICGAVLPEGVKFCESCGAAVEQIPTAYAPSQVPPAPFMAAPSPGMMHKGNPPVKIIAGIVIVLVVLAVAAYIFVLPKMSGGFTPSTPIGGSGASVTTQITSIVTTTQVPAVITAAPTRTPDPFPNALHLKDGFPFGSGNIASEANVYRVWINDSYEWHNDMDNKYYLETAKSGNKFLFVFLNVYNKGDTRVWPPTAGNVKVYYNGQVYSSDPNHFLPDIASDRKASAIEVKEVQYFSKFFGSEYVEDYGYSHGTQYAYLYPGKSNAIDGYIVFQVPKSLTPDKTYAEIEFNGNEKSVWNLG